MKALVSSLVTALATLLVSSNLPAAEAPLQDSINSAITKYVEQLQDGQYQETKVEVQNVDPRLQLSECTEPLELKHRPSNRQVGRLTFKVMCNGPESWAIHVPVTVQAFDQVVVSDLPIARGTHLSENDLRLEIMDVSRLHSGYFRDINNLSGYVARRAISAGQVMNPALVDPARMINRGEKVVIIAESPGLSIRSSGEALQDGAYGELIRVKNTSSNKIVEGRITAPGQIKVSL